MMNAAFSTPDIDADYVLWMEHQIDILRERSFSQLDMENLLDELEYFLNKRKRVLRSRLRVLMLHLLKYEFQPALRSNSWICTICTQRRKIEDALDDSPSLGSSLPAYLETEYRRAVQQAVKETGLPKTAFPASPHYTQEQLLDFDFMP